MRGCLLIPYNIFSKRENVPGLNHCNIFSGRLNRAGCCMLSPHVHSVWICSGGLCLNILLAWQHWQWQQQVKDNENNNNITINNINISAQGGWKSFWRGKQRRPPCCCCREGRVGFQQIWPISFNFFLFIQPTLLLSRFSFGCSLFWEEGRASHLFWHVNYYLSTFWQDQSLFGDFFSFINFPVQLLFTLGFTCLYFLWTNTWSMTCFT